MRALVYLLLLSFIQTALAQSTLGRSFKVKGKRASNEAYKEKAKEAHIRRNKRIQEQAAKRLEEARKKQLENNLKKHVELANTKCGVYCSDQTLYFTCSRPAPSCLNGEAADIKDGNGQVIGKVAAKVVKPSTGGLARVETCTLSCPDGSKQLYACDALEKPKCGPAKCIHTCANGDKKTYDCFTTKPICEQEIAQPTQPQPPAPTPQESKPITCTGESFRCGYFTLNTCNTGGIKVCPSTCEVKCASATFKQLCRLRPMNCSQMDAIPRPIRPGLRPTTRPRPFIKTRPRLNIRPTAIGAPMEIQPVPDTKPSEPIIINPAPVKSENSVTF